MLLKNVGEKKLIAQYIQPLFNPKNLAEGVGDDCALIPVDDDLCVCVSTDRVPADLIAFKLGLIGYRELGQYLAVLNISDIAASGGIPKALLLNLAFPSDFRLEDMLEIMIGVKKCATHYGVTVVGGDLSDAKEMNLVATSLGFVRRQSALLRRGAQPGDKVFCSDYLGISATAFLHYLQKEITPMKMSEQQETILTTHFRRPKARVKLGQQLSSSGCCTSAMDVTDGVAQSFSEIATSSGVGIVLDVERLPIHSLSQQVAQHYGKDVTSLVLDPAADFQLVGTLDSKHRNYQTVRRRVKIIGDVISTKGLFLRGTDDKPIELIPRGWNYYL